MVNTAKLPYFLHKRIKIVVEFDLLYYHNDASNTLVLHVPYSWRPITLLLPFSQNNNNYLQKYKQ